MLNIYTGPIVQRTPNSLYIDTPRCLKTSHLLFLISVGYAVEEKSTYDLVPVCRGIPLGITRVDKNSLPSPPLPEETIIFIFTVSVYIVNNAYDRNVSDV